MSLSTIAGFHGPFRKNNSNLMTQLPKEMGWLIISITFCPYSPIHWAVGEWKVIWKRNSVGIAIFFLWVNLGYLSTLEWFNSLIHICITQLTDKGLVPPTLNLLWVKTNSSNLLINTTIHLSHYLFFDSVKHALQTRLLIHFSRLIRFLFF